MKYIQALRPVMGVFSSLLCLASLRLQAPTFVHEHPDRVVLLLIAVFCGVSATMVWNDYIDRYHDRQKGKDHAYQNSNAYCSLARWLWCVSAVCVVFAGGADQLLLPFGIVVCCLVGLFYDQTYKILGLSMVTVGLSSAALTLFAVLLGESKDMLFGIVLFVSVALTVTAREILKDMEDVATDRTYKKTLPVAFGRQTALFVSGGLLLVCALINASFSLQGPPLVIAAATSTAGLVVLLAKRPEGAGKIVIDVGMVAVLTSLLAWP